MKLQPPTIGPIVGYTTHSEVRLWQRGEFQAVPGGHRRAFGASRLAVKGTGRFGPTRFVKLEPHFDVTGVCVHQGLSPQTEYDYQIGWFFAETGLDDLTAARELDWKLAVSGSFRTGSAASATPRRYAVGSCRYLLQLFGSTIFDNRGDKTFKSIFEQHDSKGTPYDGVVMLGDQIYADDAWIVAPDRRVDQYLERYRIVFGQPWMRTLMARVPTYMILDDHEIEDNWPAKASQKDRITKYPAAIHAYQIYQCSHSPLFALSPDGRIDGTPEKYWYTFTDGCCDWFMMDTRTERVIGKGKDDSLMVSERQEKALHDWLGDNSGRVKMIGTSVPFFPDQEGEGSDKWTGFRAQRGRILDRIFALGLRNVVFLAGDVHCSFVAELTAPGTKAKVTSVVSSSFFWPYPHTGASQFRMNHKLEVPTKGPTYTVKGPARVIETDNFARVEVNPASLSVQYFDRRGDALGTPQVVTF